MSFVSERAGQTTEISLLSEEEEDMLESNDDLNESDTITNKHFYGYTMQTDWQKDLLAHYGNVMTLMDATLNKT